MKHRALIIEDDSDIAESVIERVDSLDHDHVWVKSQEEARQHLSNGGFTYVLLDLQIPMHFGRGLPSIEYGEHLAAEIHQSPSMQSIPIIAMTAYGADGFGIAGRLFEHGVVDCINKPFPTTGRTLASVIQSVLDRTYRKRERTTKNLKPEKPFSGGDLTFYEDRIELCGVTVVASGKSCQMWGILDALKQRLNEKRYKAFPGSALAGNGGQNSVAGSIRDFRRNVAEWLGRELGLKVEAHDVIETSKAGYRLNARIVVKDMRNTGSRTKAISRANDSHDPVNTGSEDPAIERQNQIIALIRDGERLRVPGFAEKLRCSYTTAKREVDALKADGRIEFVGPFRTGYYAMTLTGDARDGDSVAG